MQWVSQNTNADVRPVIDVHVHAMDDVGPLAVPMCPNTPKFTASDPGIKEAPSGWVKDECTPKLYPAAKGQYIKEVVAEMERMNVAVVSAIQRACRNGRTLHPGVSSREQDSRREWDQVATFRSMNCARISGKAGSR